MPKASRTNSQGFSRVPRRGTVALVTTVLAVLLLFNFKPLNQVQTSGLPLSEVVGSPTPILSPLLAAGPQATPGQSPAKAKPTAGQLPSPSASTATDTFTGNAINTPYGTVQIALVVQNGKIIDVKELQMPSERQLSAQISSQAGPLLRQQVLQAQSSNINGVSGASYTSNGFYQSLQSALSQMSA